MNWKADLLPYTIAYSKDNDLLKYLDMVGF